MFNEETVFILGSGASWHYGYPTGEDLVKQVRAKASDAVNTFSNRQSLFPAPQYVAQKQVGAPLKGTNAIQEAWSQTIHECEELAKRLTQINPLVIDYFLGQNPTLQSIGKLMIAWVILECEANHLKTGKNFNRAQPSIANDDWLRFVLHALLTNCKSIDDLCKNKVMFITFNYDISLERNLCERLCMIDLFNGHEKRIEEFLKEHIVHVYGKVYDNQYLDNDPIPLYQNPSHMKQDNWQVIVDRVNEASKGIRVIDPDNKEDGNGYLGMARQSIQAAHALYFLGYGFDENNNERLNLESVRGNREYHRSVYFTNFGDKNVVNKRAGKNFFADEKIFLSHNPPIKSLSKAMGYIFECEKSVRNVYEALGYDFDL